MQNDERHTKLTRRSVLLLAGAGLAWAGSSDPWEKKDPADWTPQEVDKLLYKSPWAKSVTAQGAAGQTGGSGYPGGGGGYPPGGGGGYPGGGYPPVGMPRRGGPGGYPRQGGGYPQGGGRGMETRQGTVRWESAKPMRAARKDQLPEAFANHYVISVSGFPVWTVNEGTDRRLDEMKMNTTLRPKGKDYAQPGIVQPNEAASAWLFGFSKDALNLTAADKEVEFTSRIGSFVIKASFNLKDMVYRKELAV